MGNEIYFSTIITWESNLKYICFILIIADGKINHDFNGTASTSRENEMTDEHSEQINIDGSVNLFILLLYYLY